MRCAWAHLTLRGPSSPSSPRMFVGRKVRVDTYVNAGRGDISAARSDVETLEAAGVRLVSDTCTYITPILDPAARVVMTDSAKWAWYAPANLGVEVMFGSRRDCVASAIAGEVRRESPLRPGGGPVRWEEFALVDQQETASGVLVPGRASRPGPPLHEPLSFWGGIDPTEGRIIDPHHPQLGESITGRVLVIPAGRGSSSSSSVLAESLRLGTGPAAIVLIRAGRHHRRRGDRCLRALWGGLPRCGRLPRGGALRIRGTGCGGGR